MHPSVSRSGSLVAGPANLVLHPLHPILSLFLPPCNRPTLTSQFYPASPCAWSSSHIIPLPFLDAFLCLVLAPNIRTLIALPDMGCCSVDSCRTSARGSTAVGYAPDDVAGVCSTASSQAQPGESRREQTVAAKQQQQQQESRPQGLKKQ